MFKFLKEKLEQVVKKFSKKVEEEAEVVEGPKVEKPKDEPVKEIKDEPVKEEVIEQPVVDKKPVEKKVETVKEEITEKPVVEKKKIVPKEKAGPEKEVKEEAIEQPVVEKKEIVPEVKEEKRGFFEKIFKKKEEVLKEEPVKEVEQKKEPAKEEKKTILDKVGETFTKVQLSEKKFNELFWDLEIMLLENNMAVEVIDKIKDDLRAELTTGKISRKNTQEIIKDSLKKSIDEVLSIEKIDLIEKIKTKKPFIIVVIGVNGSGKTTAIAKLTKMFQDHKLSVVLAAADTFRAAAIDQLEEHAKKLDVKIIKHEYNSDPTAVAFDAIKHAEAKGLDVVLIDTAGRLHSNDNLMQELQKLIRVNKPDFKLFVGESITGNDCVEQAKKYDEMIGIDGIMLTKADVDEKGGAPISISYVTKKPVLFIGTGQNYGDIKEFNKEEILGNIGL